MVDAEHQAALPQARVVGGLVTTNHDQRAPAVAFSA